MPRKLTAEQREKFVQELIAGEFESDLNNILGPFKGKGLRKSLKTPIEKVINYNSIVSDSVFWASRQAYLEVIQSFLSKKIDGETLSTKFFKLRSQDMIRTDELCAIIEDRILPIPDLYYTFKAKDFSSTID